MSEKLRECPNCGEVDPNIFNEGTEKDGDGTFDNWVVECPRCELHTNAMGTEQDALEAWNTRHELQGGES